MALVITLLLGIGNFAWHRAVIESGHRMVSGMPPNTLKAMRIVSLALEFVLLCGALFAIRAGQPGWVWAYLGYSLINGGAAWLLITRRI